MGTPAPGRIVAQKKGLTRSSWRRERKTNGVVDLCKAGYRAGTGRREQGKAGVTCCCWQCHSRSPSSCATLTAPTPGSREMVRSLNTHLQAARIRQLLCKELLASLCYHYFTPYSDAFCIFNNFHFLENKICPSCSLINYFIGIIQK